MPWPPPHAQPRSHISSPLTHKTHTHTQKPSPSPPTQNAAYGFFCGAFGKDTYATAGEAARVWASTFPIAGGVLPGVRGVCQRVHALIGATTHALLTHSRARAHSGWAPSSSPCALLLLVTPLPRPRLPVLFSPPHPLTRLQQRLRVAKEAQRRPQVRGRSVLALNFVHMRVPCMRAAGDARLSARAHTNTPCSSPKSSTKTQVADEAHQDPQSSPRLRRRCVC